VKMDVDDPHKQFGYYEDINDEEENSVQDAPRTDADADAAETLASFPKGTYSLKS
jgi:hypothetical protein